MLFRGFIESDAPTDHSRKTLDLEVSQQPYREYIVTSKK